MEAAYSAESKDKILRDAFRRLSAKIESCAWIASPGPYTALRNEALAHSQDPAFSSALRKYLADHAAVRRSFQMFFTTVAMASRARWQESPEAFRGIVARGWFLGRWVPTFLIIGGPVGRFVFGNDSPLTSHLSDPAASPMCTSVRNFLNDRTFRLLRNGFAHWSFDWEVVGPDQYVVAYDYDRDMPTAKLHLEEADAYHIIAFAIVEILNDVFVSVPGSLPPKMALEPPALT